MDVRPVTQSFFDSVMLDMMPHIAAQCDFGLNNASSDAEKSRMFGAFRQGLMRELFTINDLDAAIGDGTALTNLVRRVDPTLTIETDYD